MEDLMGDATKIRKRGCSPSSSSSSVIQNYRFKRAILVGKRGGAGGSSTPVPTWRLVGSRSPSVILRAAAAAATEGKPGMAGKGRQQAVSARKLAATLWEMNEVPSPRVVEGLPEKGVKKRREKGGRWGGIASRLSDPSHSPVSERGDRSGLGSHRKRDILKSGRLKNERNIGLLDSISNASFMETETRSRCQTPGGSTIGARTQCPTPARSTIGVRTRLKDVSNALTTSKELVKIISRVSNHEDQPSSSMSLISALHAELERARLQVNQLIHEQRSDQAEIGYLLKRFAEEKAVWESKERETVEAAIESIAGELEVERKLRRRLESLNKRLGKELTETRGALTNALKELKSEKRARGIMEQVCDELTQNVGEDKDEAEDTKRASLKTREEVKKEREMFKEKSSTVDQLRNELEAFLRPERSEENGHCSVMRRRDRDLLFGLNEEQEEDRGEVEDATENSVESDLHSIELNINAFDYPSMTPRNSMKPGARKSTSLMRSLSNVDDCGNDRIMDLRKQVHRRSCGDETQRYRSMKGLRDQALSSSRLGLEGEYASPVRERENVGMERLFARLGEAKARGQNPRRTRR